MSRLNQLLPASWKGITFLVRNEVITESGRRIILHDYPNSSERYIEDQGLIPPKFSVTAFVTGADFIDRAEQLERALQEEGAGRLSMPTFGIRKLYALPYRKDASQTAVGEIRFELSFVAGRAVSGPSAAPKTIESVYALGDLARSALQTALADLWIEPENTSNVLSAQFDLEQTVTAIEQLMTDVSNMTSIEEITELIDANGPSLVRSASDLASSLIGGLWQSVSEGLSGGDGLATLQELTGFGSQLGLSLSDIKNAYIPPDDDSDEYAVPLWSETTAQRIERNRNRLSMVNSSRISALVSAFEQAADTTYSTETEIEEARFNLESEHRRLMNIDTDDRDFIQSQQAVRDAVEDVRLSALDILDQKEQAVFTLAEIETQVPISAFVLAYNLYAEGLTTSDALTDRAIELRALNPLQPADKLDDTITVLQS